VFLTGLIFVVLMVNFYVDFEFGIVQIMLGIIGFVFAYMLYEARFIGGVADVKFIIVMAMMISTIPYLFIMFILIMVFGFVHLLNFRFILKRDYGEEIPFLFPLLTVYITLYILGGLI